MAKVGRKPGFTICQRSAYVLVRRELLTLGEAAAMLGCSRPTVSRAANAEARRRGQPMTCQMDGRADAIAARTARFAACQRVRATRKNEDLGRTACRADASR